MWVMNVWDDQGVESERDRGLMAFKKKEKNGEEQRVENGGMNRIEENKQKLLRQAKITDLRGDGPGPKRKSV